MKTNPLTEGILTEKSTGLGMMTRMMMARERAIGPAIISGCSVQDVSKSDRDSERSPHATASLRLRNACGQRLLPLLLFLLPAAGQAQFNYTTNEGALTVTGYTGPGEAAVRWTACRSSASETKRLSSRA